MSDKPKKPGKLKPMGFTAPFIRRPVMSLVITLIILLLGLVSLFHLPVRQWPKIKANVIQISTIFPGASAKVMDGYVTSPILSAISGINGVDYVTASSSQGASNIVLNFRLGFDINDSMSDVRNAVASVRYQMPETIRDPVISTNDSSQNPMMYVSFTSDKQTTQELTNYLETIIKPQLDELKGVGKIELLGGRTYAIRIWLNPEKLAAYHVTFNDVLLALNTKNVAARAGSIKTKWQSFTINVSGSLESAKAFQNMVVKNTNGVLTRLKQVANVELGSEFYDFSVVNNGQPGVSVAVIPQSGANPLSINNEVTKALAKLQPTFPKGTTASMSYNTAHFIRASLEDVLWTIFEAAIIVIFVTFLFLGSFRNLLIPIITIPVCIIGVLFFMDIAGFSINTLTMLAMVLAIGLVVDDAIVVSENIYRFIEGGLNPHNAALVGAHEIRIVIISITITLAAVLAPIGFTTGLVGALFKEFSFALAGTVIISGFIALTLSPMMCSKLLSEKVVNQWFPNVINTGFVKIALGYKKILKFIQPYSLIVVVLLIGVWVGCYFFFSSIPSELAPKEDMNALLTIAYGPPNANIQYTEKYSKQIEKIYRQLPETTAYTLINGIPEGPSSTLSFALLTDSSQRDKSVSQLISELRGKYKRIIGLNAVALNPFSVPGAGSGYMPVNYVLTTNKSYRDLYLYTQKFITAAKKNRNFTQLRADLVYNQPQLQVNVNRLKAAELGVDVSTIGTTLNLALGEPTTTRFIYNGKSYPVIPQLQRRFRNKPDSLNNLYVRSNSGKLIALSNFITVVQEITPPSLNRFQSLRSATINGSLKSGYTLGEALNFLDELNLKMGGSKQGFQTDLSGESRQFKDAQGTMAIVGIFSLIFIYLVLAAQFESFIDPLIVIFTVPAAAFGALILMKATGATINIYTEIGLLTLVGLITKHGVLIIEFCNQQQLLGISKKDAIIEAATVRFRPILMTTFAMVFGALPLALATGAGATARNQIGWTIVGGMAFGTLISLVAIPALFYLIGAHRSPLIEIDQPVPENLAMLSYHKGSKKLVSPWARMKRWNIWNVFRKK